MVNKVNRRISAKLLVTLAIFILVLGSTINYWFYQESKSQLVQSMEREVDEKLSNIVSLSSYYIAHFENELIAELGKSAMLDKEVKYLLITGSVNHPYFQAGSLEHGDLRLFRRELSYTGNKIGSIEIGLDMTRHNQELSKALWFTISAVVFTIFMLSSALFVVFRLQLLAEIKRAKSEELLLRRSALELEQQVEMRTHDLLLSNRRLNENINERIYAERALYKEKEQLQVTLHSINEAVITTDVEGCVTYLNPIAEQLTGWSNAEAKGRFSHELFRVIDELTGSDVEDPVHACLQDEKAESISIHNVLINRHNKQIAVIDTAAPMRDCEQHIIGVVLAFRDVSEERRLRQQLMFQAKHDELTGLINRREFEQYLTNALASTKDEGQTHALLYLDLDQFKLVNDTCGHFAGDALLRQLSMLLHGTIRTTDTLARLGGDEFGVILDNCSLQRATEISQDVLETVRNFRFVWVDRPFEIGVSIGLVMIDADSKETASIMSAADMACYAAKDLGRNRVHLYQESDEELSKRQGEMHWASLISKALEQNRMILFFQEICAVNTCNFTKHHCEILIRMLDNEGKIIPPGAFLPAAERYNLILSIDRWVIDTLFCYYAEHRNSLLAEENYLFSINLSGASLNDVGFGDYICEQADRFEVPPTAICFEITETVAVANLIKANDFISKLKEKGFSFSLDDFGCGFSSFSYLKNLPVNYLKIDGSFVKDIANNEIDYAMVSAINEIGQVMNIKTIAEYVEDAEILAAISELKINYAQGFYLHKPSPLNLLGSDKIDFSKIQAACALSAV